MTFPVGRPLEFPQDEGWVIPRHVHPLEQPEATPLDERTFVRRLMEGGQWYGLLSAEGTGKTTFLNGLQAYCQRDATWLCVKFPLGLYPATGSVIPLLQTIDEHIRAHLPVMAGEWGAMRAPLLEFVPRVRALARIAGQRLLLLLDDFQKLDAEVALSLSAQLKHLHNEAAGEVVCLIAGDSDLQTARQDHSPLRGIVELYTLLDWNQAEVQGRCLPLLEHEGVQLDDPDAQQAYWDQCRGYPAMCWMLAEQLRAGSAPVSAEAVGQAAQTLVEQDKLPWLKAARRYLESGRDAFAMYALTRLQQGEPLRWGQAGGETLFLKGVLAFEERQGSWRNRITRTFFEPISVGKPLPPRLRATGTIHVTLVMNLRHFVIEEDKASFNHIRGNTAYEAALASLENHIATRVNEGASGVIFRPFEQQHKLQSIAADLNIVRFEAARTAFAHIYELQAGHPFQPSSTLNTRLPANQTATQQVYKDALQEEWIKWRSKSIQLTRDGLVLVRLERDFWEEDLAQVLRKVTQLEADPVTPSHHASDTPSPSPLEAVAGEDQKQRRQQVLELNRQLDRSIQWEFAMAMVEMFIKCFFEDRDGCYHWPGFGAGRQADASAVPPPSPRFTPGGTPGTQRSNQEVALYPLYDRYITFVVTKLCICESAIEGDVSHQIVRWKTLRDNAVYAVEVHGLLEGVLVGEDKAEPHFPPIKERDIEITLQNDLSSWDTELCLLSQDNGFIYYDQWKPDEMGVANGDPACRRCTICNRAGSPRIRKLHFSGRPNIEYRDYWLCILYGLEYVLNLRLLARLVAFATTRDLTHIADLDEVGADDPSEIREKVQALRRRVDTNTRLLAHLRDVTTPLFIAQADYATRKFDTFIKMSGLERSLANIEEDLRAINTFLQHHDAMLAQRQTTRLANAFSWAGFFLAFLTIFSFMVDFEDARLGKWLDKAHLPWLWPDVVAIIEIAAWIGFVLVARHVWRESRRWNRVQEKRLTSLRQRLRSVLPGWNSQRGFINPVDRNPDSEDNQAAIARPVAVR